MAIFRRRPGWKTYLLCAVIATASIWPIYTLVRPVDEVILTIGESYEQARLRSRSTLGPRVPNHGSMRIVTRPAKLRFFDSQFGFVTPPAKFLAVMYDGHGNVSSLRLSPQVKVLPFDKTMTILTDLQNQFERGGWKVQYFNGAEPRLDALVNLDAVKTCRAPMTRWQAADKYQVSLHVQCFRSSENQTEKRYLITISLSDIVFRSDEELRRAPSPDSPTPDWYKKKPPEGGTRSGETKEKR